jgi:hypothetical protein
MSIGTRGVFCAVSFASAGVAVAAVAERDALPVGCFLSVAGVVADAGGSGATAPGVGTAGTTGVDPTPAPCHARKNPASGFAAGLCGAGADPCEDIC